MLKKPVRSLIYIQNKKEIVIMQTTLKRGTTNNRLTPFVGNNPVYNSEQGGMINYSNTFSGTDFLMPISQLHECMSVFSSQIQEAVTTNEND